MANYGSKPRCPGKHPESLLKGQLWSGNHPPKGTLGFDPQPCHPVFRRKMPWASYLRPPPPPPKPPAAPPPPNRRQPGPVPAAQRQGEVGGPGPAAHGAWSYELRASCGVCEARGACGVSWWLGVVVDQFFISPVSFYFF